MESEDGLFDVEEIGDGMDCWDCVYEETETFVEETLGGKHQLDHAWKVTQSVLTWCRSDEIDRHWDDVGMLRGSVETC